MQVKALITATLGVIKRSTRQSQGSMGRFPQALGVIQLMPLYASGLSQRGNAEGPSPSVGRSGPILLI
jgi:hypothetical protein